MHTALACVRKYFTVTGHLKSANKKCFWRNAKHIVQAVTCLYSTPQWNASIAHHDCRQKTFVALKWSPDHTVHQITW